MTQHAPFNHQNRIAHRGGAATAPENTLAAFRQAADFDLTSIELDVSLAQDESLVIWHDETVDRCSNGTGKLADLTQKDLAALDAGAWFSPDFAGEPVAFLTETLQLLQKQKMALNLEIKVHGDEGNRLAELCLAQLKDHWADWDQLVISSFDWECLRHLRSLSPGIKIGLLMEDFKTPWLPTAQDINAFSIHCDHETLTSETIDPIKEQGYALYAYTVNDAAIAQRLLDQGVDAIISDCPRDMPQLGSTVS